MDKPQGYIHLKVGVGISGRSRLANTDCYRSGKRAASRFSLCVVFPLGGLASLACSNRGLTLIIQTVENTLKFLPHCDESLSTGNS
ncbi:unnamed protein product [Caenorhabditis auriculariae]|uniref:Uncharacterized protein n=1 Tax=Caenorhabditis auriculariae TaxID=2777116 RepID=A0A8S1H5G5_9PELO|nr:unnamed protein product [Caenorhabditis auriculariae]